MDETIKEWLIELYHDKIVEVRQTIMNEHIWELGYAGEDPNPHTQNIEMLSEYLLVLDEKIKELK